MSFYPAVIKGFKTIFALTTLLLLFPPSSFAGLFKVTEVFDGDTIKAKGHGTEIKIRMAGIDAPEVHKDVREKGQPFSEEAKGYLARIILNKDVEIKGHGYNSHDLISGTIFLNGKNINLEMARAGMAEVRPEELPGDLALEAFLQAEREAKAVQKGIWAQGERYISPKDWRQTERARSACAILLYGICGKNESVRR